MNSHRQFPHSLWSVSILLVVSLLSACGNETGASQQDSPPPAATADPVAPAAASPKPSPSQVPMVEDTPARPATPTPEPAPQPSTSTAATTAKPTPELAEAMAALAELKAQGRFLEARNLAQDYAESAKNSADAAMLQTEVQRFRDLARQGSEARRAIEMLGGNSIEQRHARAQLLNGGEAAGILLGLALPTASPERVVPIATMLAVIDAPAAFPALTTLLASGDDSQIQAIGEILTSISAKADAESLRPLLALMTTEGNRGRLAIDILYGLGDDKAIDAKLGDGTASSIQARVKALHNSDDAAVRDWSLRYAQRARLLTPGFRAEWFGNTEQNPPFILRSVETSLTWPNGDGSQFPPEPSQNISARFTGTLRVPETGSWTMFSTSDDGSRVLIDEQLIVDNWGMHGMQEVSGAIALEANRSYAITVDYMQGGGGAGLIVEIADPSGKRGPLDQRFVSSLPWNAP